MAGTRSSARLSQSSPNGNKRKADEGSPPTSKAKRGKKAGDQQTIEQSLDNGHDENGQSDQPMPDANAKPEETEAKPDRESNTENNGSLNPGDSFKGQNKHGEDKSDPDKALKDSRGGAGLNVADNDEKEAEPKSEEVPKDEIHEAQSSAPATQDADGGAVEADKDREAAQPSNILEKGIIYFFTRGRVEIDNLESVQDLQRSHFVLRPIPDGAKLGDGKIDDQKNARLIALPKKVWPKSPKDRFMAFVEKAGASVKELKDDYFPSTQTSAGRDVPPVTPIGEGVYAITSTGNRGETHLAYILTIPQEPGNLQEDVGIKAKGSFLVSLKNPEVKGPANASLPQKPDFPKEFFEEFRNRSWMPAEPKHIDYPNAQVLLIGESFDESHALEATKKDQDDPAKNTPMEELEKLEDEDTIRIQHLKGDDSIFTDLQISKNDYPDVQSTW